MRYSSLLLTASIAVFLNACSTAELAVDLAKKYQRQQDEQTVLAPSIPADKNLQANARYKVGDPYQIEGKWYYPERDLTYDKTGIGSWYGDEFAGKPTANGEIFDPNIVSAAHKTLPMPSVVRVTNLDNGKSLVVRINDRGPFVAGRIIDLSREAARLIGYKDKGIARVRVQILPEETLRLEKLGKAGQFPLLNEGDDAPKPEVTAAKQPSVKLTARTTRSTATRQTSGQSSVELLTQARKGLVLQTEPIATQIWVQIGAFHSETNAQNMLEKMKSLSEGRISEGQKDGKRLYRVQLGPAQTVQSADALLRRALQQGYNGANIIVD